MDDQKESAGRRGGIIDLVEKTSKVAEIISVGTELLMGQIIDTNAAYLAENLSEMGINAYFRQVCGDNMDRLVYSISLALERADIVIMTGGLGPTRDDISMEAAALALGLKLLENAEALSEIEKYFSGRGRKMAEINRKQALLPENSLMLPNKNGTAPGALIKYIKNGEEKILILMPGPPGEMKAMFTRSVKPCLDKINGQSFKTIKIRYFGIGESELAEKLDDLISSQENPSLATYCSPGQVMLRITERFDKDRGPSKINELTETIIKRTREYIYEIGDRSIAEVTADLLQKHGKTLSLAESCTAGLLASDFVNMPGASGYLLGSIVAYSNSIKEKVLKVPKTVLEKEGAVSEASAEAMAEGARLLSGSDYACSVTGIAGPGGGNEDKPVGTVWIGISTRKTTYAVKFQLKGDREKIRRLSVLHAENLLRKQIIGDFA